MEHNEDEPDEDERPPLPKKQKITSENPLPQKTGQSGIKIHKAPPKCADFLVSNLEDFYRHYPPFRQPLEVGSFSFDSHGKLLLDRSGLRHYTQPSKLALDLKVGYSAYKTKLHQSPDLNNILTWISHHWQCFLPKLRGQRSIDGLMADDVKPDSTPSLASNQSPIDTKFHLRPDNLLTDFICWRGLMTKLLCTPYNKSEPWKLAAVLHHGTIYLRELDTVEGNEREVNMSSREKQMSYWGLKFEDYMTSKDSPSSSSSSTPQDKSGTINPLESFCTVVRTRLNSHSMVMCGEVDCYDHMSREKPPLNYIELKTNRFIYTDRNKASFKKNKLLKWWAQSFLVGVPKIICGFRDDDGIVNNLQPFRTIDIPRECQSDLSLWQASVCLNFLDELLNWMKATVTNDDLQMVYIIEWNKPFTHISATHQLSTPDTVVLHDWYLNKQEPLTPKSQPPSPPQN